ncbi:MFS transporter [Flammeovirga sp. EKP202]|uniref:MFS transporter n=1 Tax=Flammeovirga sp. EKP202 TaxID=2770592 RepID=UPI00165F47D4|nr:MFS transporter [Flammeovirga sp. EKP202]MBD0401446.1 MFS transporter [Flammeovirga sp. EKP202]
MNTHVNSTNQPLSIKEKIGYALGDGAANIAWRGVATFLLIFYTDVFGIAPAVVGVLMLVARSSDGLSDVFMGIVGDRTKSKYGKFRPWILWTAIPLGAILSLLFTTPDLSNEGKVIYAYTTYILFTLIYTANNIPYGALMAVMTGNDKERTSLGSYRMVGAFTGGMIVQGALLYLVATFGNVNPSIQLEQITADSYLVTVSAPNDVPNANIKTKNGIASFQWEDANFEDQSITPSKSFLMEADFEYTFSVTGEENLTQESFSIINQKKGYSTAIYVMSVFLTLFMFITFYTTKERIAPPKRQKTDLGTDFKDLLNNRPWFVLLLIGLLFNIYNSIKQGIVVIYFTHYLNDQLLAASYMIALTIASIGGAMITASLGKKFGKKKLFIYALLFSAIVNALLFFCGTADIVAIFTLGIISEFASAIFPTLFFAMLGDVADYSEYTNGRRATGLVYSAGSFATKFGGGIAAAIIGFVLSAYHYDGLDHTTIEGAIPGIKMLMSWVPALIGVVAAGLMYLYPLNDKFLERINIELNKRRSLEENNSQADVLEEVL